METSNKRHKLDDRLAESRTNSLDGICNWSNPESTAIEHHLSSSEVIRISYSELNRVRTEIARSLEEIRPSTFVGIHFNISRRCVPALLLGINSSGRAFINLPSITPTELCARLGITHLFSQSSIADTKIAREFEIHGKCVKLLELKDHLMLHDTIKENCERFAYAITTSGSTGASKLVKVTHSSIVPNILDLARIFAISTSDKIAQLTALTFDPSIVEIFLSLCRGSTLLTTSKILERDSNELLKIIFQSKVTVLQCTPSVMLHKWSRDRSDKTLLSKESQLKILLLGGEPFPKLEILSRMKDECNETRIFNIYGITELSCWASINEIDLKNTEHWTYDQAYLGQPLSQTIFEVRSEANEIIREGRGVLYIGSDTRICLVDDEEIRAVKLPVFRNSGDVVMKDNRGNIFYKQRYGTVIKRFGNKLNLKTVENSTSQLNFVQNAFALWVEKEHKLHLYFSVIDSINKVEGTEKFERNVKDHLKKLPSFYQPDTISLIARFELTENGKICKKALARLSSREEEAERPLNFKTAEETLKTIWENLLSRSTLESRFLKSGGTSITALQITTSLSEKLREEFPELIGILLRDGTLGESLEYVSRKVGTSVGQFESSDSAKFSVKETSGKDKRSDCELCDTLLGGPDECQWQKCRGRSTGRIPKIREPSRVGDCFQIEIWKTYDLKKCIDASPTIFQLSSGQTFVTVGSHSGIILTVELNDSNPVTYKIELPDRIEASVVVLNGCKGVVGCYDGYVYCLNLITGEQVWKFKTGDMVKCTAIMCKYRKKLFVGSYDRHLYCLCIENGSEIWRTKISSGSISATPCLHPASNLVFCGTLDGTCAAICQDSGELVWKYTCKDPIFSAPNMCENGRTVFFCSVSGDLTCFETNNGNKLWTYSVNGNVFSHLVVERDSSTGVESVIFSCQNKQVYRLELQPPPAAPKLRYTAKLGSPVFATPYCDSELMIVVGTDGELRAYNFSSGELLVNFRLNGHAFSSPVRHGDVIVVGCRDNNLYTLRCTFNRG